MNMWDYLRFMIRYVWIRSEPDEHGMVFISVYDRYTKRRNKFYICMN